MNTKEEYRPTTFCPRLVRAGDRFVTAGRDSHIYTAKSDSDLKGQFEVIGEEDEFHIRMVNEVFVPYTPSRGARAAWDRITIGKLEGYWLKVDGFEEWT